MPADVRVLAFDTSADVTAVAVLQGDRVLAQDATPSAERHAQLLLPRVQACLASAGLALAAVDLFAVGIGPGSFTGVRVGLATAKGFALATGKPVRGVVSLVALARAAFDASAVPSTALCMPVLDAHKNEVFAGVYERATGGTVACVLPPFHAAPASAAERLLEVEGTRARYVLGSGYRRYAQELSGRLPHALDVALDNPSAVAIALEAQRDFAREGGADLAGLLPAYLRGSDAQLPKAPLRLS